MTALLFMAGTVVLVAGGELLVRGAARIAAATGVSPLVIGLTVVAFATSSPEMAVSVRAAAAGQADIAVGNVVGSNIFNVLFILGVSALVIPLSISAQLVRLDVPVMIGVSVVLLLMSLDRVLSRGEALILALGLIAYVAMLMMVNRRSPQIDGMAPIETGRTWVNLLLVAVGLGLLVVGAQWLVRSAIEIAQLLGVTELVIGLTVVAAGTSIPELATSVVAGVRGQRDIAVGNVIGSNIFNILGVLGVSGLIPPDGIAVSTAIVTLDMPVMIAVALLCFPIFFSHEVIPRWEGLLFLVYYGLYTTYLVLDAANHEGAAEYGTIVLSTVVPLTVLTISGYSVRSWLERRERARAGEPRGRGGTG